MKLKRSVLVICFCLAISLCFTSCVGIDKGSSGEQTSAYVSSSSSNGITNGSSSEQSSVNLSSTSSIGITKDTSNGQAGAYFTVFQELYEGHSGLRTGKYIAVDLTKLKLKDTAPFIKLMQNFCGDKKRILLQDTFEGLKKKGYIKDFLFEDGFLITFKDLALSDNKLVTSAEIWQSGLGAFGSDYTVEKKNGSWEITKTENIFYS